MLLKLLIYRDRFLWLLNQTFFQYRKLVGVMFILKIIQYSRKTCVRKNQLDYFFTFLENMVIAENSNLTQPIKKTTCFYYLLILIFTETVEVIDLYLFCVINLQTSAIHE